MKNERIVGIFLAAGNSQRMGKDKRALPFKGSTIGTHAFQAAVRANFHRVFVVTREGDSLSWLMPSASSQVPWTQIECPEASGGQSYSIKCGVKAAMALNASAVVVILSDRPCIATRLINTLVSVYEQERRKGHSFSFVSSRHQGIIQPPVLFTADAYPELLKLEGDKGARFLFKKKEFLNEGIIIDWDDPLCFYGIDQPLQYRQLLSIYGEEEPSLRTFGL